MAQPVTELKLAICDVWFRFEKSSPRWRIVGEKDDKKLGRVLKLSGKSTEEVLRSTCMKVHAEQKEIGRSTTRSISPKCGT